MDIFHDVNDFVWKYLAKSSRLQVEPVHCFPMSDMEAAFKQIEQEPNHGLTMMMAKPEIQVPVAHEIHTKPLAAVIDPQATYVLAGGLGGLGKSIAKLLADNGAKKLVFLSRSGGSPDADVFFKSLPGVDARAIAVDITDRDALERIVPDLGRIAGVVQCAAVIKVCLCRPSHMI